MTQNINYVFNKINDYPSYFDFISKNLFTSLSKIVDAKFVTFSILNVYIFVYNKQKALSLVKIGLPVYIKQL